MRYPLLWILFALLMPIGAAVGDRVGRGAAPADHEIGFLVAAPDRGFLGDEEIRDLFDAFAGKHNAALVFVTDERTRATVHAALAELKRRGARQVVVLPLFVSEAESRFATLKTAVAAARELPVAWGRTFGASYFAVEALADRLRAMPPAKDRRLVLVGSGAADSAAAERLAGDLRRIGQHAAARLGFSSVEAVAWPEPGAADEETLRARAQARLKETAGAVVAPLHLGKKLDSMMAFANTLRRAVTADSQLLEEEPLTPLALTWMRREANRALPWRADQIGVIVAAHGSDWHWNETMRQGARPLEARHPVEYAFSMADPPILERAVRKLEQRGVRAIVIVRVFGLADSFERDIERLIGRDLEARAPHLDPGTGEHDHGHGEEHDDHGHGAGPPVARIRSGAVLLSAGGLDDHGLFAQALLERAQALSRDPARETVILTAHGAGDDGRNEQWLRVLESLAAQMKAKGGARFRDIRVATWREDWPDKREPWVRQVRGWVEEASRDGTAIVIPARTTGAGPEAKLLAGLEFRAGTGFAPHPLFARWLEEQVARALDGKGLAVPAPTAQAASRHGHRH
ncbi:MAG: sirohydrochlorin chelatase [Pseudomonadota bacterium]